MLVLRIVNRKEVNGKIVEATKEMKYKAGTTRAKAIDVAEQMWQEEFGNMSLYVYEDGVQVVAFES